jgi:hypothetical protein
MRLKDKRWLALPRLGGKDGAKPMDMHENDSHCQDKVMWTALIDCRRRMRSSPAGMLAVVSDSLAGVAAQLADSALGAENRLLGEMGVLHY